jgi:hypothetical protein
VSILKLLKLTSLWPFLYHSISNGDVPEEAEQIMETFSFTFTLFKRMGLIDGFSVKLN